MREDRERGKKEEEEKKKEKGSERRRRGEGGGERQCAVAKRENTIGGDIDLLWEVACAASSLHRLHDSSYILLVFLSNLTLSSSFEQFCIALVNFFSKSNTIRALQFNLFLSLTNIKKKKKKLIVLWRRNTFNNNNNNPAFLSFNWHRDTNFFFWK